MDGLELLVIEDDPLIRRSMKAGWPLPADRLTFATNFAQSFRLISSPAVRQFDGFIIDINLPDGNGLAILRTARVETDAPIIMISGSGTPYSRAEALDQGADDYVMKPFHLRELQARVARLIKRHGKSITAPTKTQWSVGPVRVDIQTRTLSTMGKTVGLTDAESRLLRILHENFDRACTKDLLYQKAFFRTFNGEEKTLDVYVGRLRRKLCSLGADGNSIIQTVRGFGYRFTLPSSPLDASRNQQDN